MSKIKTCPDCKRGFGLFRRRHRCAACGSVGCRACSGKVALPAWASSLSGKRLCGRCHEERVGPLRARYEKAVQERVMVFAYVGKYVGDPPADPSTRLPIESGFHPTKNEAVMELQTIAAFHGRNAVEDLELHSRDVVEATSRPGEGPLPYGEKRGSAWKAKGTAVVIPEGA